MLAEKYTVFAIDTALSGIAVAKKAFPKVQFKNMSVYDDFAQLGLKFDAIVSVEVIEHSENPAAFLENAFRVLKPGGRIIITCPYHGYLKNLLISVLNKRDTHMDVTWVGGHIKLFSMASLSKMLKKSGFEITSMWGIGRFPLLWKSITTIAVKRLEK